jgi:hypothetical protein
VYLDHTLQGSSWFPLHICGVKPTLPCTNQLKQDELLRGEGLPCLTPWSWRAIEDKRFLGCQRDQGALRGGKAGGVKDAITNIGDFVCTSVVAAVVFRQDHLVQPCPSLLAIAPQRDLRLGHPRLDIKVVARQGDTPIAIRRAGKERVGKFLREHLRRIAPALRRPQDLHREGGRRWSVSRP